MGVKKVKGFNYDQTEDKDVIAYLRTKKNVSSYIIALIRQDMACDAKFKYVVDSLYSQFSQDVNCKDS